MRNNKNSNVVEITSANTTRKPRDKKLSDEERFRKNVSPADANGCELWNGKTFTSSGYGAFSVGGRSVYAHRFAWSMHNGGKPVPDGLYICHECDNRLCQSKKHLRAATAKENSADMVKRGRSCAGRTVTRKPFTKEETERLITLAASGSSQYRISKLLGRAEPTTAYALKKNAAEIQKKRAKLAVANALEAFNTSISVAIEQLQSSPLAA